MRAACSLALLTLLALPQCAESAVLEFLATSRGNVPVLVPDDYVPGEPLPLIMALHGRSGTSTSIEERFDLELQVDQRRFIYVRPQGTSNILGTFWNATDACCDFFGSDVDDSGYLRGVLDLAQSTYTIDPDRIHVIGFSNGGFMAHRMAIDHADIVGSIVSVAGANFKDAQDYQPSATVHSLEIHGTSDLVILYNGGSLFGVPYPGAIETQSNWAFYNQLDTTVDDVGAPFDLDVDVAGPEATAKIFDVDNEAGIKVELWTLDGSPHSANFGDGSGNLFAQKALDWIYVHPKPRVAVINAESASVIQGQSVSGGPADLLVSDDQDWVVRRTQTGLQARTTVELSTTCPTNVPRSIRIRLEGSVFSRPPINQSIELYNYTTGFWETVDVQPASRFSDLVVDVRPAGEAARFVDSTTLEMKARLVHEAPENRTQFSVNLDELSWTVFY